MDYKKIVDTDWSENFPDVVRATPSTSTPIAKTARSTSTNTTSSPAKVTRLTQYKDYDVKYPSIGPNQIVYQNEETLAPARSQHGPDPHGLRSRSPPTCIRMRPEFDDVSP